MAKLKLGLYPYTYVRTIVMRSLLLKKEEYHKLLKMGFNEIAKYLQDSQYKDDINKLAAYYSGAELIERALSINLIRTFSKLKSISSDNLKLLIDTYLQRYDIQNIKTVLRAKYTKADEENIVLLPVGALSKDNLQELIKKATIEDILKNLKIISFKELEGPLKKFKATNNLMELENFLDRFYYNKILSFIEKLPREGELFKEFLESEIDVLNIITLLKLKREKLGKDNIKKYLLAEEDKLFKLLTKMIDAADIDELIGILDKTDYKPILAEGIKEFNETKSLIGLERALYIYLLKKSALLQHQHPLSIDIILGYMFAKEIETKNIMSLIKGKQMGLDNSLIESHLVVA